jgi:hypothetical protein
MKRLVTGLVVSVALMGGGLATAQEKTEDVVPGVPFQEGDVIEFEQLSKLKDYLPPEFWKNREYFFYEGMNLEIGPFHRDYEDRPRWVNRGVRGGATLPGRDRLQG